MELYLGYVGLVIALVAWLSSVRDNRLLRRQLGALSGEISRLPKTLADQGILDPRRLPDALRVVQQIIGVGGIPSAEAFGRPTIIQHQPTTDVTPGHVHSPGVKPDTTQTGGGENRS